MWSTPSTSVATAIVLPHQVYNKQGTQQKKMQDFVSFEGGQFFQLSK
jgi:hypothetical protein